MSVAQSAEFPTELELPVVFIGADKAFNETFLNELNIGLSLYDEPKKTDLEAAFRKHGPEEIWRRGTHMESLFRLAFTVALGHGLGGEVGTGNITTVTLANVREMNRLILLPAIISTVSSLQSYYWQPEGLMTRC